MIIALFIALALLALWVTYTYNFFVSSKARIKAAIQEIGNQLKRQVDLIPNLEASVKGYMKQEKEIFRQLTDARRAVQSAVESGDLQKMADAGSQIANVLPALRVAVEDNPEIKSSEVVAKLMDELRDTADKVMYARRLVIDLTADYNVKRVSFPSNLVASIFNFTEIEGMVMPEGGEAEARNVDKAEMETPKIDLDK